MDGKFSINGKEYSLPMKFADFKAIPDLVWEDKGVTEFSGRTWGTESFFLNKDQNNQIHLVPELYNFTKETIKKEDALIIGLSFNGEQGKLFEVSEEEWLKIFSIESGRITIGSLKDDFVKNFDLPVKGKNGSLSEDDKNGFYTYEYDDPNDNTVSKLLSLQFTKFASKDKSTPALKSIHLKVDESKFASEGTNEIK